MISAGGLVATVDHVFPRRISGRPAVGAVLRASEYVLGELWLAAAVGPGICGTPDGSLTMPVTTCELYLDISLGCGVLLYVVGG